MNQFTIHPDLLDTPLECWEGCGVEDTPDIILGHLCEVHNYDVEAAQKVIENWANEFTWSDSDKLMDECEAHGWYIAKDGCHGCHNFDSRLAEWKENRRTA